MTKNHSPVIAELKAGVVQIVHETGQAPEKFFVSGGFALTHANSVTVRARIPRGLGGRRALEGEGRFWLSEKSTASDLVAHTVTSQ